VCTHCLAAGERLGKRQGCEAHGEEQECARQHGSLTPQERQGQKARYGVLRQDIPIPHEQEVREADAEQRCQATHDVCAESPPRTTRAIELNRKPDTEQKRKQDERLELDCNRDEAIDRAIQLRPRGRTEELLENRDSEFSEQIDEQNSK
jgi:hypothetical protein